MSVGSSSTERMEEFRFLLLEVVLDYSYFGGQQQPIFINNLS